jgi:transposase
MLPLNARELTDLQWAVLDALIPEPPRRKDGRGRHWRSRRSVLNGILWVLRADAPWADLPERYPSYQTCHRRFQQWVRSGIMRGVLEALAEFAHNVTEVEYGNMRSLRQRVRQEF